MIYLSALLIFLCMGCYQGVSAARLLLTGRTFEDYDSQRAGLIMVSAMSLVMPLNLDILNGIALQSGDGVRMDGTEWHLWLSIIGCVVGILTFGFSLWKRRFKAQKFIQFGADVIGLMICVYISFAIIDHLVFFNVKANDAGIVNWAFFKEAKKKISDMKCDKNMILAKNWKQGEVTYRCPHLIIVLGQYSQRPFVPWPDYSQGISTELAIALNDMFSGAMKSEKSSEMIGEK